MEGDPWRTRPGAAAPYGGAAAPFVHMASQGLAQQPPPSRLPSRPGTQMLPGFGATGPTGSASQPAARLRPPSVYYRKICGPEATNMHSYTLIIQPLLAQLGLSNSAGVPPVM